MGGTQKEGQRLLLNPDAPLDGQISSFSIVSNRYHRTLGVIPAGWHDGRA
jgi:hypothetical protein